MQIPKSKATIFKYLFTDGLYEILASVILFVFVVTTPFLKYGHTDLLTIDKIGHLIFYFLVFVLGLGIISIIRRFFIYSRLGKAKAPTKWLLREAVELFSPLLLIVLAFAIAMVFPLGEISSRYNVPFSSVFYFYNYLRLILMATLTFGAFYYLYKITQVKGFYYLMLFNIGVTVVVGILVAIHGFARFDVFLLCLGAGLLVDGMRNFLLTLKKGGKNDNK